MKVAGWDYLMNSLYNANSGARQQGALAQWIAAFEGGFTGIVATLDTGRPVR